MEPSLSIDSKLKDAISLIINAGYQLDSNAFIFLKTLAQNQEIKQIIEDVLQRTSKLVEKPIFITKEMIEESKESDSFKKKLGMFIENSNKTFQPLAKEIEAEIEIIDDPTNNIKAVGNKDDFLKHFQDRFNRIEQILKHRIDTKNTISINEALKTSLNSSVNVIGIITDIRERKKILFIQIEDFSATATILVPPTIERRIYEKAQRIFLDQVVCIQGKRGRENLIIATDFINPDIPDRTPNKAETPIYTALLSDLHVGSKKFLNENFNNFIQWLRGKEGNQRQREIAGGIKYLIICGDLVDGIGVYPNQENELAINDVYEQYENVAKILQNIPEYIEIVIIPGNHDATRQALPQPVIPKKYSEPIYEARKTLMLGNPARIRLHGVEFLLYHGRSLDDVISVLPDVTYRNLNETVTTAMRSLLKVRHLAPIYGKKTPIAPEPRDSLIIDTPPDVFHVGHVHVMGYETYRGTLSINSGTWQSQTEFQKKMNLNPTPGIVPIVNLSNLQVIPISFIT